MSYRLSRFTSFLEKNNSFAVYCNFNLFIFKGKTYKWFKQIINSGKTENVCNEFIDFLFKNEIIEKGCDSNE